MCGILALVMLASLAAGCGAPAPESPAPTRQVVPTATPLPPVQPTPATTPTDAALELVWWAPEFISPKAAPPSGPLLEQYLAEFEAAAEGRVRVTPVLKARYGKGGLLDSLRTAQPVAPSILPDIVSLDLDELQQAVSLGLLRPLNAVDDRISGDLYPSVRAASQFDAGLMAVPVALDLQHVVYDKRVLSRVPETWVGLLSDRISYIFPAAAPQLPSAPSPVASLQRSILSGYLSAGGLLDPETRQLTLQEQPLLRLLTFYADATAAGLLPAQAGEIANLDDIWGAYTQGAAQLANASARRYLAERGSLSDIGFAALPGWSGPAGPVLNGWALAIVTQDPVRQAAAVDFLEWLLAPERVGKWTQAAGWLPASPEALSVWGDDPYYDFLDDQLRSAVAPPVGPDSIQAAQRLQQAVLDVLKGGSRPEDAARSAISPARQ